MKFPGFRPAGDLLAALTQALKDVSGTHAYTDTWVKRPGSWVRVATHASRIAQK